MVMLFVTLQSFQSNDQSTKELSVNPSPYLSKEFSKPLQIAQFNPSRDVHDEKQALYINTNSYRYFNVTVGYGYYKITYQASSPLYLGYQQSTYLTYLNSKGVSNPYWSTIYTGSSYNSVATLSPSVADALYYIVLYNTGTVNATLYQASFYGVYKLLVLDSFQTVSPPYMGNEFGYCPR